MFSDYVGNLLDSWGFGQKDATMKEKVSQHQERHFELIRSYQKLCQETYSQMISASLKGDFNIIKDVHKTFLQGFNQTLEAMFENNIELARQVPERLSNVINTHRSVYENIIDKFPSTKEINSQMRKNYMAKGFRKLALSSMSAVVASMMIPSAGEATDRDLIPLSQEGTSTSVSRTATAARLDEGEIRVLQTQLDHRTHKRGYYPDTHVLYPHENFDASQVTQSNIYSFGFPKATMLHPYHPGTGARGHVLPNGNYMGYGHPTTPLFMHLSADYLVNLPEMIQTKIRQAGIQDLKIMVMAQNFPWQDGTQICLRPHYATEPNVPGRQTGINIVRHIDTGVFSLNKDVITFAGRPVNTFNEYDIHTHTDEGDPRKQVLLSADQPQITGLSTRGHSFWSYVGYTNDAGQRTALMTLHLLVNDQQCNALQAALDFELPRPGNQLQNMLRVVNRLQVEPSFNDGGGHVEELAHLMGFVSPKLSYNIAASDNTGIELAQPGFSWAEGTRRWTEGRQATMVVPIGPDARTLSFADTGAFLPGAHVQRVGLTINGNGVGDYVYDAQHPSHTIKTVLQPDIDVAFCEFNIQNPISPQAVGMSADDRALGIQFKSVEVGTLYRIGAKAQHNLGEDRVFPYRLVEGFSDPQGDHRWTVGNRAVIEIPLDADINRRPHIISFENTHAFVTGVHSQALEVIINGSVVGTYQYTAVNNSHTIGVKIPSNLENVARIEFNIMNPVAPVTLGVNQDARQLGIQFGQATLRFIK